MRFIYKAPFLKAFDKILPAEQELVGKADQLKMIRFSDPPKRRLVSCRNE